MSELCPVCKKPFHERRKRMLAGIPNGKKGRPREFDYSKIRAMKLLYPEFSIRRLAQENKVSQGMVQRALKDLK